MTGNVNEMTRREFLITTATVGAGAAIVAVAGCAPAASDSEPAVPPPSTSFGEDTAMSKRILVGYATGAGSTVGVAESIGETLGARGFQVDVRPMKERPSVREYDAVVLGSAINGGRWLPEAVDFLGANQQALRQIPTSLFCVHAMNCGSDPKKTQRRLAYLDQERALVTPASEGFFAGVGPTGANANPIARWAFRLFGGDVEGDGRDWEAITEWAEQVPVQERSRAWLPLKARL